MDKYCTAVETHLNELFIEFERVTDRIDGLSKELYSDLLNCSVEELPRLSGYYQERFILLENKKISLSNSYHQLFLTYHTRVLMHS